MNIFLVDLELKKAKKFEIGIIIKEKKKKATTNIIKEEGENDDIY